MNIRKNYSSWVEKYRPLHLEDYVAEETFKKKLQHFIDNGRLGCHLMLQSLTPGTGKTTATKILTKNIDCDYKYINASDQRGIDAIREDVAGFAQTQTFKPVKIMVLDEADALTPAAQASLRGVVEQYASKTEFIFTCNYIEKIIAPLRNRCVEIQIPKPSKKDIAKRLVNILQNETIEFDIADVKTVVDQTYPSIRKAIGILQECSLNGTLDLTVKSGSIGEDDYTEKIKEALKNKKDFTTLRQILIDSGTNSFEQLYTRLYNELEDWVEDDSKLPEAIMHMAEYQYKDAFVVDKEINTAALLFKLTETVY